MRAPIHFSRSLPPALVLAVVASVVAHAALLTLPASDRPASARPPILPIETQLAPARQPVFDEWKPIVADALPPLTLPPLALSPLNATAIERPGELRIAAHEVSAYARLGDLLERQMNEFPREVQAPVRFHGIEARYPPDARAQGIEGTVLAWVVVDATAHVEEVQIVEGDEIFRAAVTQALEQGSFMPAADGGAGLRFPITLEFRFALDTPGTRTDAARPVAGTATSGAPRAP